MLSKHVEVDTDTYKLLLSKHVAVDTSLNFMEHMAVVTYKLLLSKHSTWQ